MSPRAKFLAAWYGSAVAWDCVCDKEQTVSHAVAWLLANRWTRWPVAVLIVATVAHLFALARTVTS